jgi:O-acetyl-ADP-ribose deacetylase (regulator of RNase III)
MKTLKSFGKVAAGHLRLCLCDANPDVADAWLDAFGDVNEAEILVGSLLDADADALVSPANSFGDMGGGVDKAIDDFFDGAAQTAFRAAIADQFLGELPVGMALIVTLPGRTPRFPFLIAAPTMRVPRSVTGTINAYLAFRAVLVAVARHNRANQQPIRTVAVPGLCTGVGAMPPGESARQMRAAWDNVIGGDWEQVVHPALAPYAFGPASDKDWLRPL